MSDKISNRGKQESSRLLEVLGGQWTRYRNWLAGMTRGQKIRYRLLQTAISLSVCIAIGSAALSAWIQLPDIPDADIPTQTKTVDESAVGATDRSEDASAMSAEFSFDGAETPHISQSGRKEGVYTFLVAGRDVASGSTDTILLLTYDTNAKTVQGLNLPRDTMMNVRTASKRINAIYSYNRGTGDEKEKTANGMNALKKAVANITGITPDFYVLVKWDAVGELVDAIDGVDFEVPFNMDYDDPYQNLHIHQKAGLYHLDGDDAMQIVRWRKNNNGSNSGGGDITRLSIQQDFLKAAAKKCLTPSIFLKAPELARIFTENVETDLTVGNILALAQRAYGMDPDSGVTFQTAPIADMFMYNGASLLTLDADGILEIVNGGMNPYLRDVQRSDLELLVRRNGSFSVTSGTLVIPKGTSSGGASNVTAGTTSQPSSDTTPQNPDNDVPDQNEPDPGDSSQSGDVSVGDESSSGGDSFSNGEIDLNSNPTQETENSRESNIESPPQDGTLPIDTETATSESV